MNPAFVFYSIVPSALGGHLYCIKEIIFKDSESLVTKMFFAFYLITFYFQKLHLRLF